MQSFFSRSYFVRTLARVKHKNIIRYLRNNKIEIVECQGIKIDFQYNSFLILGSCREEQKIRVNVEGDFFFNCELQQIHSNNNLPTFLKYTHLFLSIKLSIPLQCTSLSFMNTVQQKFIPTTSILIFFSNTPGPQLLQISLFQFLLIPF